MQDKNKSCVALCNTRFIFISNNVDLKALLALLIKYKTVDHGAACLSLNILNFKYIQAKIIIFILAP